MTAALPDGFVVRLREDVRRRADLLVGGSPKQVVRLSPQAMTLIGDGRLRVASAPGRVLADRLLELNLAAPVVGEQDGAALGELTVVVPVRDRPAQLDRLLAALGGSVRCLVVDDASRDRAAVAAVAARHGAEVVRLRVNAGPAAARNAGLRLVETPFVAFVDSDVVVAAGTLQVLLSHFTDPGVVAVAPRVRAASAGTGRWFERYEEARSSLDLGALPAAVRPWSRVSWLPSACLVTRAATVGAFDASLRVAEDVDLVWRLVSAGHRVRYEPAAEAWHDTRTTVRGWLGRKFYYGTGGDLLARRHGDLVAPAVLSPLAAAAGTALLAQRRWSVPVAAVCLLGITRTVASALSVSRARIRLATGLAALGLADSVSQVAALALRHWWPVAALASLRSRRLRRALVLAGVLEAVVDFHRVRPRMRFVPFLVARRLDDAAYGLGLWCGAVRGRSVGALRPVVRRRVIRRPSRPPP
jgi:mycofactocin system glycosyltransferase